MTETEFPVITVTKSVLLWEIFRGMWSENDEELYQAAKKVFGKRGLTNRIASEVARKAGEDWDDMLALSDNLINAVVKLGYEDPYSVMYDEEEE